jgi:hypothetical protein
LSAASKRADDSVMQIEENVRPTAAQLPPTPTPPVVTEVSRVDMEVTPVESATPPAEPMDQEKEEEQAKDYFPNITAEEVELYATSESWKQVCCFSGIAVMVTRYRDTS